MDTDPYNKTPVFRKFRWLFFTLSVLLVIGLLFLRFLPGKGLEREIEALRNAGLPTTPAELNAWYPQVPPSNNAALLVTEAAKAHGRELSSSNLRFPDPGQPPDEEFALVLEPYLKTNHFALEKLYAAAERSGSRYPIDLSLGFSLLLPHLADIKGLAQLLRYEGIYHSANNQPDRAFRSVTTSFALARTLRDEPLLISGLVRIACLAITLSNLEYLLSSHPLSEPQLKSLLTILDQAESDGYRAAFRALAGERAGALPFFTMPASQLSQNLGPGTPAGWEKLAFDAHRILGLRDRDLALYLDLMAQFTGALTNPFPRAFKMSEEAERQMDQRLSSGFGKLAIITRMILPALSRAIAKEALITTRLRCARAAVAVELYRLANNGQLPKSLPDLLPAHLAELPRDAAEGELLQYEILPVGGYTISSPAAAAPLKNPKETTFSVLR